MILVVANNDLELLALRAAVESLPAGFPPVRAHGGVGLDAGTAAPPLDGVRAVLVRLHKGRSAWEAPFDAVRRACVERRIALLAFGGEAQLDAELTALSTAPAGIVTEAAAYWAAGGPANLANLLRFVADTVLLEGFGFEPPADLPSVGRLGRRAQDPARPTVGGRDLPGQRLGRQHAAGGPAVRCHRGAWCQRPGRALLLAAHGAGRGSAGGARAVVRRRRRGDDHVGRRRRRARGRRPGGGTR